MGFSINRIMDYQGFNIMISYDIVNDPVCKMDVKKPLAYYLTRYRGTTYYFCCSQCKAMFEKNPERYING